MVKAGANIMDRILYGEINRFPDRKTIIEAAACPHSKLVNISASHIMCV